MIKPHLHFLLAVPAGWLIKTLEIFVLALCLVMAMYDPVSGYEVDISTSISSDSITVGDKFLFTNTIEGFEHYKIDPIPIEEQLGDATVLSDIFRIPDEKQGTVSFACTLAIYKPGGFEIPPLEFNITDSLGNTIEVSGQSILVTVYSVLPDDTSGIEIADIKEPMKLRGPIWPYIIIPLAIVLIVLSIILSRKYFRKKTDVPVLPPRPPWEIAYEKLDRLKAERHTEFGRLKMYYFNLSLIIREYIEARYEFPAAEYTTYELGNADKLKEIEGGLYSRLFALFNRADLAKFAKFHPDVADADSDMKFAYDFVSKTIPVIESAETEDEKLEVAVE
ncbi:MAG: hypothetical protein JSU85_09215 [Candidatus Zixiibacteriota bacterium]|nr:MAG: hypothetical protein JSU85_09215 [candidate division Zixibacteria bacterium]